MKLIDTLNNKQNSPNKILSGNDGCNHLILLKFPTAELVDQYCSDTSTAIEDLVRKDVLLAAEQYNYNEFWAPGPTICPICNRAFWLEISDNGDLYWCMEYSGLEEFVHSWVEEARRKKEEKASKNKYRYK